MTKRLLIPQAKHRTGDDPSALVVAPKGLGSLVRLAATREDARKYFNSALFSGDVLIVSASARSKDRRDRFEITEEAFTQAITEAMGQGYASAALACGSTQAAFGTATLYRAILLGASDEPTSASLFQASAISSYHDLPLALLK